MTVNPQVESRLNQAIGYLNTRIMEHQVKNFPNIPLNQRDFLTVEKGRKQYKLITCNANGTHRSVYGFVDFNGHILKAASWRAPAKHVRGSIFDESYSWGKAFGQYGVSYMK